MRDYVVPASERSQDRLAQFGVLATLMVLASVTWRKWGYLPVDSGREMYVPAAIAQGKRLYFDLWYPYGPLIPYWHAALFRLFGIHLGVLLGAGIGVVATAAFFLYRVSREFLPGSWSFAVVLAFLLQAFEADLFNYVLPYSYPAAYGSMLVIVLLWLLLRNDCDPEPGVLIGAGLVAGLTALAKLEFGAAAYAGLACWLIVQFVRTRSLLSTLRGAAAFLPGAVLCIVVYGWYIHSAGADFFLGQNLSILPSSHFQQHFAAMWNLRTGLDLSPFALALSIGRALGGFAILAVLLFAGARSRLARWITFAVVVALALLHGHESVKILRPLFFNSGMIWAGALLLAMAAKRWTPPAPAVLLCSVAFVCGLRTLTKMAPEGYSIYFDVLAYLMWLAAAYGVTERNPLPLVAARFRIQARHRAATVGSGGLLCIALLALTLDYYPIRERTFPVASERGLLYTTPEIGKGFAEAVAFLETAKRQGQRVVILPEDTALYFFSGTLAPSRWYLTLPQVLPPGELTAQYLQDLDRASPDYILVSNRATPEFGLPLFGVDYAQQIKAWIDQHYRVAGRLGDDEAVAQPRAWGALVYERK